MSVTSDQRAELRDIGKVGELLSGPFRTESDQRGARQPGLAVASR